ncbi:MAG: phosphoadenylyl-sulfate reductase [Pseudomonadota bacterium]
MHAISQTTVDALNARYAGQGAQAVLRGLLIEEFPGAVTLVSSFGAESAVLLHMAARIDRAIDVVFVNTGKLFGETLRYKADLVARLGLLNVRTIMPKPALLDANDPKGDLWARNADRCCYVRKVEPLARALKDVNVWISGRKGFHGGARSGLPLFELVDGRIKVNPLTDWTRQELEAYFTAHGLPRHPLEADGYPSVGCMPCTSPVKAGEGARAGRWRGLDKSECGIHIPLAQHSVAS